jgi:hypothetical protein
MSHSTVQEQEESNIVYTMPRHEGEEIHFTLRKYKGRYYVDLRLWFQEKPEDAFKPTKKGISVGAELLPQLQEGLTQLHNALIKAMDWDQKPAPKPPPSVPRRRPPQGWSGHRPSS